MNTWFYCIYWKYIHHSLNKEIGHWILYYTGKFECTWISLTSCLFDYQIVKCFIEVKKNYRYYCTPYLCTCYLWLCINIINMSPETEAETVRLKCKLLTLLTKNIEYKHFDLNNILKSKKIWILLVQVVSIVSSKYILCSWKNTDIRIVQRNFLLFAL